MFYNSTGLRFALQKFESVGVSLCFQFSKVGWFLLCSVFVFVGKTSHPSLVFFSFSCIFSSINIIFFVSDQKKNKLSRLKKDEGCEYNFPFRTRGTQNLPMVGS